MGRTEERIPSPDILMRRERDLGEKRLYRGAARRKKQRPDPEVNLRLFLPFGCAVHISYMD